MLFAGMVELDEVKLVLCAGGLLGMEGKKAQHQ